MKFTQFCLIILLAVCGSSAEYTSIFSDKNELPLILGNFQNKLSGIANTNSQAFSQTNSNAQALNNIQSQLNQVIATNTATKNANDLSNSKLTTLILSISSFNAAIGAIWTAIGRPLVGAAYQNLANAVRLI